MSAKKRQGIGVALLLISCAVLAVFGGMFVRQGLAEGKVVGAGSSGNGGWILVTQSEMPTTEVIRDILYLAPVVLCGAAGLLCVLWPSRKPPKLTEG